MRVGVRLTRRESEAKDTCLPGLGWEDSMLTHRSETADLRLQTAVSATPTSHSFTGRRRGDE